MRYRAIIFDFNGVLLWDAALQVESWKAMALQLRGRELTEEECALHMHGRPNAHVLSYLAGRPIQGEELLDLMTVKESNYRQLCLDNPKEFVLSPGARDLLDALAAADIPRTIATSSEKTNVEFFRTQLQLDRWFNPARIVHDDGKRRGKPAPDMYLAAAELLGLSPADCIVVEDAISGLEAARAAGIGHIIALGPQSQRSRLAAHPGVSTVIESLTHFPRKLLLP